MFAPSLGAWGLGPILEGTRGFWPTVSGELSRATRKELSCLFARPQVRAISKEDALSTWGQGPFHR